MTRADFTRTSVTDPSVTGQCNSIPIKNFLSAPKEVFTSKTDFWFFLLDFTRMSFHSMTAAPNVLLQSAISRRHETRASVDHIRTWKLGHEPKNGMYVINRKLSVYYCISCRVRCSIVHTELFYVGNRLEDQFH